METGAWSAVWTCSRYEHRVGKGLPASLSTVPRAGRRTERRKARECPLFPGYLSYYGLKNPGLQHQELQDAWGCTDLR